MLKLVALQILTFNTFNIGTPFNGTGIASNPLLTDLLPERQESYELGLEMSFKETPWF
jgi:hypothetical protein